MSIKGQIYPIPITVKKWKWDEKDSFLLDQIIVFVGHVPSNIYKELNGFEKNFKISYSNYRLDAFFGKGFVKNITAQLGGTKRGGRRSGQVKKNNSSNTESINIGDIFLDAKSESETETETESDAADEIFILPGMEAQADEPNTEDILDITENINEASDIDWMTEATAIKPLKKQIKSYADDDDGESSISIHDVLTKADDIGISIPEDEFTGERAKHTISDKVRLVFIHDSLWSVSTPMDLKKKIWTYLKIPMPNQHINFVSKLGDTVPLYYNIYNNNKLVKIELCSIIGAKEKYNNIPILNHYYAFRDFFNIKCLDNFTLLSKFTERGGTINLYDAGDFLDMVDMNAVAKDLNTQHLLYYGFFILFWPMITIDVFHEYISADCNISKLQKIYPELLPNIDAAKAAYKKEYSIFESFHSIYTLPVQKRSKIFAEIEKNLYIRIVKNTILNFSFGTNKLAILSLRNLFDKFSLDEQFVAIKYNSSYNGQNIVLNKTYKNNKEIEQVIPFNCLLIRCRTNDTVKTVKKGGSDIHTHKARHADATSNIFDIYFYDNGNYFVKCMWGDSSNLTFDESIKIAADFVNIKVINQINKWKNIVINQNYEISHISPGVVQYSHINAEIYYRKNLVSQELNLLRVILQDFHDARIFTSDTTTTDSFNPIYYLLIGNHQQDEELLNKKNTNITNTYEYLSKEAISTKWNQIYVNNKSIDISLRNTDIRFGLHGLWDSEFNIVYTYILLTFYLLGLNLVIKNSRYAQLAAKKQDDHSTAILPNKKKIKSLKQIDPVLYDFKRYPGISSRLIYSKICQKPNQPQILTHDILKNVPEKDKKKVVKYWNFTTKSDAYYYAPNPRYPYISFIIGKHPLGYCIPCAKKTSSQKKNNTKKLIYDACMMDHKYESKRINIITGTRYIMSYGKSIDPGRLCRMPENTLEPLFYESFSENNGVDEECFQDDRYFLLGVDQEWNGIQHMGMFNTILVILEFNEQRLATEIKKKVLATPTLFNIILNGDILTHFYDYKEFIDIFLKIFLTKTIVDIYWLNLPWNNIFIDILFYYFNIVTVEFVDRLYHSIEKSISNLTTENDGDHVSGDNVEIIINRKVDIILTNSAAYTYIIIVRKKNIVNPIFLVNPTVYFKTKVVNKKIFTSTDNIVSILAKLLIYNKKEIMDVDVANDSEINLNTDSSVGLDVLLDAMPLNSGVGAGNDIDIRANNYYAMLGTITRFIESHKQYKISEYFINAHNQCYYIGCTDTSAGTKETIYVPVVVTDWTPNSAIKIIYGSCSKYTPFSQLNHFLIQYNKWIAAHIDINTIDGIRIEKWIAYGPYGKTPTKVLGFIYSAINYYFTPISVSAAQSIKKVPMWQSYYDIGYINQQIHNQVPIKTDKLVTNISTSFYEHYLYQILLIEFTSLFSYEKNIKLRTDLKKKILSKMDILDLFDEISNILAGYYNTLLVKYTTSTTETATTNKATADIIDGLRMMDYNSMIEAVNTGVRQFTNKMDIYNTIDRATYNFDHMTINKFKTMNKDAIHKELMLESKKVVQFGEPPKSKEIPNILTACGTSTHPIYYCRSSKLIINETKFKKLLGIMVADIQNPMKEKWLFSPIFNENIINYLKFERRPLETITVEIIF